MTDAPDLTELPIEELIQQMHDDLYDGMAEEVEAEVHELLLQTSMPIIDITTACGFQSPPHFSRCYRAQFGCPPSAERQSRHGKSALPRGEPVPA